MLYEIWFANAFCFSAIAAVLILTISCLPSLKKPKKAENVGDGSTARAIHYAEYGWVEERWGR